MGKHAAFTPSMQELHIRAGRRSCLRLQGCIVPKWRNGRRRGFKIPRLCGRAGSSPALGTTLNMNDSAVVPRSAFPYQCRYIALRRRRQRSQFSYPFCTQTCSRGIDRVISPFADSRRSRCTNARFPAQTLTILFSSNSNHNCGEVQSGWEPVLRIWVNWFQCENTTTG